MIRRMFSVHLVAIPLLLTGTNFARAQCASGGCATWADCAVGVSGCAAENGGFGACGGGCLSGRLGRLHGEGCYDITGLGEACLTCDNVWDGYCASKPRCPTQPHCPLQNLHGCKVFREACGGCNVCARGVGIYGRQTCPPRSHGRLLKDVLKKICKTGCATTCATFGRDVRTCDSGSGCAIAPVQGAVPAGVAPEVQPSPAAGEDSVPPAPAVSDQTKTSSKPHAFDWLQRVLELN